MALQVVTASLLFYPMSVRHSVVAGDREDRALRGGLALLVGLLGPLLAVLGLVIVLLGRHDLLLPGLAYFAGWQMHEGFRRGLFCEMRHRDAVVGDVVCYGGSFLAVLGLRAAGSLDLASALAAMACVAALAALVQARRLGLPLRGPLALRATARDFVAIGGWSLMNNLVNALRVIPLLWVVGLTQGAGGAASLQALLNVVNLVNPLIIGITNVLPQVAARARRQEGAPAWLAARAYIALGSPLVLAFALVLAAFPGLVLGVVYGAGSPYAGLGLELRMLTVFLLCGYWVEMVCAVLHGLDQPQQALGINVVGALASLGLAVPLTMLFGLAGTCAALSLGALGRLAAAQFVTSRPVTHDLRAT